MANNKLQELTERLYEEGLSKGREEGDKILAEANERAKAIIEKANADAQAIIEKAGKAAEDTKAKAESDIRMAASQALASTKADILGCITAKVADTPVANLLGSEEFTKEVILAVAKGMAEGSEKTLEMVLPETVGKQLEQYTAKEVAAAVGTGIEVTLSKKIKGGLTVGPKDGGYFVSMTDETFSALIREYLRPATRKILFGE